MHNFMCTRIDTNDDAHNIEQACANTYKSTDINTHAYNTNMHTNPHKPSKQADEHTT
jgi:hypothetical protein